MTEPIKLPPLPPPGEAMSKWVYDESDMQAYDTTAIEADRRANTPESLTPAEAVFAFAAWLTSREQSVTFGAVHGAAIAADLASEFTKSQGLQKFREDFHKHLMPYPSESSGDRRQARGDSLSLQEVAKKMHKALSEELAAYDPPIHHVKAAVMAYEDWLNYTATQPQQQASEPVAWLCTPDFEGEQFLATTQGAADTLEKDGWSVQPLYDAPQPKQQAKGEPGGDARNAALEEASQLLDRLHDKNRQYHTVFRQAAIAVRTLKSAPDTTQPQQIHEGYKQTIKEFFVALDSAMDLDKSHNTWSSNPKGTLTERVTAWGEVNRLRAMLEAAPEPEAKP